jgi:hypothetical protein
MEEGYQEWFCRSWEETVCFGCFGTFRVFLSLSLVDESEFMELIAPDNINLKGVNPKINYQTRLQNEKKEN